MSYIWPWPQGTSINQPFGTNPGGVNPAGGHTGTDGGTPVGTPLVAPADGIIEYAQWFTTDNGSDNPYWITNGGGISVVLGCYGNDTPSFILSHLSATDKNPGDRVKQGDIIGYSGNTGKWTTGPHTHFEAIPPGFNLYNSSYGRVNPANYCSGFKGSASASKPAAVGNQRLVGADNVNQRAEPNTTSKIVRVIPGSTVETFTGFVSGEAVSGNNVWYKDDLGYAWSGGFESQSTAGLPDLTPKAPVAPVKPSLKPNERLVGADNVNQRAEPNTGAKIVRVVPGNTVEAFTGYVYGESVSGNSLWYKDTLGYAWSGGFDSQSTTGLPNQTPTTPTPAPKPVPTPTAPVPSNKYTFAADFDFVEVQPADLSNLQRASDNPGVTVFPPKPTSVIVHQFDAKAKNPSMAGVINYFKSVRPGGETSAHFVVSGNRIVQMVSLKDRAYHAGAVGNNYVGIEVDPQQDAATIASTNKLIQALNAKYGYKLTPVLHMNVAGNATNCGSEINIKNYQDNPVPPVVKPEVPPVVKPAEPKPATGLTESEVLDKLFSKLKDFYFDK